MASCLIRPIVQSSGAPSGFWILTLKLSDWSMFRWTVVVLFDGKSNLMDVTFADNVLSYKLSV